MKCKRKLNRLGQECKKKLIEIHMSQKELAKRVGTTDKYLDLIFHNERAGTKYIFKIAEILNLNLADIEENHRYK